MPDDTLSVYARSQPGKLGVIDDRRARGDPQVAFLARIADRNEA
jgi:hypothetical protein